MINNIRLSDDPYLKPYLKFIQERKQKIMDKEQELTSTTESLLQFASAHEYYGMHLRKEEWVFREWAPNATKIVLFGDFTQWEEKPEFELKKINANGDWEIRIPKERIRDKDLYKLHIFWQGGDGERIPAYARRVVQDPHTNLFSAQVWLSKYKWKHRNGEINHSFPKIYEAHIGMSGETGGISTFDQFRENILPRILDAGYNTLQLMGVQEHPYYGSFGYHVANFFAPSSRFGTPQQLKELIDEAHRNNLAVIIDLIHSHAVKNEHEGLSKFDGTPYQYFHGGNRGLHDAWDSRLFDYGKIQVLHFLLSNCRYWIDEFNLDGFRFDGVTSMLYTHNGIGYTFTSYDDYFNEYVDTDAYVYLSLANKVIHQIKPTAVTIAEDISGMPGLAYNHSDGGCGFDYRQAMGVSDLWFKMLKDTRDEDWNMDLLWYELTNHRAEEHTISYVECHDQALVGGKTLIFELADKEMYTDMHRNSHNYLIDRAVALHKMARLATFATAKGGYLNFMGNEFGHPEWVDFPREGNNWSYHYSRRQWSLRDNPELFYYALAEFDRVMLRFNEQEWAENPPKLLHIHNEDKIMVFRRGKFVFLFNFHPEKSFPDYYVALDHSGIYTLTLDTDQQKFGGFQRIQNKQVFYTMTRGHIPYIQVYLPARTAMVIEKSYH